MACVAAGDLAREVSATELLWLAPDSRIEATPKSTSKAAGEGARDHTVHFLVRFGILGFGLHAVKRLMPGFALAQNCRVTALSRRTLEKAQRVGPAAQYPAGV